MSVGKSSNPVVVLGMHRSGTSAITRGLIPLGVALGDDLIPAAFDNVKGFWEDRQLTEINQRLQSLMGYEWYGAELSTPIDFDAPDVARLYDKALDVLQTKLDGNVRFAFKDPRTSLVLEFWLSIFERLKLDPAYVIALRNPLDVAKSLEKRNALELGKSLYLWQNSFLRALELTKDARRIVVSYEAVLMSPSEELERISERLGLPPAIDGEELDAYKNGFLSQDLQHEHSQESDWPSIAARFPTVDRLYSLGRDLATDRLSFDGLDYSTRLNECIDSIASISSLLSLYVHSERAKVDAQKLVANLRSQRELGVEGADVQIDSDSMSGAPDGPHSSSADSEASAAELAKAVASLETERQSNEELREKLHEFEESTKVLQERVCGSDQLVTEYRQKATRYRQMLESKIDELRLAKRDLRDEHTLRMSEVQHVAELEGVVEGLRSSLSGATEASALLEQQRRQFTDQVNTYRLETELLRSSFSWRVTSPVRKLIDLFKPAKHGSQRSVVDHSLQFAWDLLPFGQDMKDRIKRRVFTGLQPVLSDTRLYKEWEEYERHRSNKVVDVPVTRPSELSLYDDEPVAEPVRFGLPMHSSPVRLIAFYLPQFHTIPENDEWWGEGFTEWTNVRPAEPQFKSHYQPHVPGVLGYYDLSDPSVMKDQARLASGFGLGGFCFYFYWFAGKTLLEKPVQNYLEAEEIDFPFCLCWANENWSRTWDGLEHDILIEQHHSDEDDIAFIEHISVYLRDSRYIRVEGKPVLLVYRPSLLPDAVATAKRWRAWCQTNGIGDIYLVSTHSFDAVDPALFGFDAATEFPPNNTAPDVITDRVPVVDGFNGVIYDWNSIAMRSEHYSDPGYKLFRGVNPSWDNTARRGSGSAIFAGSSPARYQRWLRNAAVDTHRRFPQESERFVFANAWNEWAEGAHLEPDQRHGYAFLNATRAGLEDARSVLTTPRTPLLLVAHDAHPHGAQYLIVNIAKSLSQDFGLEIHLVVLGDGALLSEYEKYAVVYSLHGKDTQGVEARSIAADLFNKGISSAICNTSVTGLFAAVLRATGFNIVSLVHELPKLIRDNNLETHCSSLAQSSDKLVFPADLVADGFREFADLKDESVVIRPQGCYKRNRFNSQAKRQLAKKQLRELHDIPENHQIVLSVGYADLRKGIDLFIEACIEALAVNPLISCIWLGHWDTSIEAELRQRIANCGLEGSFVFPGIQRDTDIYFAGSDLFALTAREDPFPTVVMEAMDVHLPVVAFEDTGGFAAIIGSGCGALVPQFDCSALGKVIVDLLADKERQQAQGQFGKSVLEEKFSFRKYLFDVLDMLGMSFKRVTAIVPNYNYAGYLEKRLETIVDQSYPVYELIVLDDASTDSSLQVIDEFREGASLDVRLQVNEVNTGSPFVQWHRGATLAAGDYIWIAEADDLCEPDFLAETLRPLDDPNIYLSYAESKQIDEADVVLCDNYRYYTDDIDMDKWRSDYVEKGISEITGALAVKNTIPNVSGVVFRAESVKMVLEESLDEFVSYRHSGDWFLYIKLLQKGGVAFTSQPLNIHRRHSGSVTLSGLNKYQVDEIREVQDFVAEHFDVGSDVRNVAIEYIQSLEERLIPDADKSTAQA